MFSFVFFCTSAINFMGNHKQLDFKAPTKSFSLLCLNGFTFCCYILTLFYIKALQLY